MTTPNVPPDHHSYYGIMFYPDTIRFFVEATKHYQQLLKADLDAISSDKDLNAILTEDEIKGFPIYQEMLKVQRLIDMWDRILKEAGSDPDSIDINLTHGLVRYTKSIGLLYLHHLQNRRNHLASKDIISKNAISAVDTKLAKLHEKFSGGVFQNASPVMLLSVPDIKGTEIPSPPSHPTSLVPPIRSVVIDSLEILDTILRKRCLDLFAQFREDSQLDRLDTIVAEATRILEDRIRIVSKAPKELSGIDLVKYAFGGSNPVLVVSTINAEQEGVHLLFRGVFGFIRNRSHHTLLGDQSPERVLQIVALVDYLIFVIDNSKNTTIENTVGA